MRRYVQLICFCMSLILAPFVHAMSVEAVGRSILVNGDLEAARARAIERAKEQASLYSMAQIATTQSIRDGILEIDNLRVNTLSRIENVEILSERLEGNQLSVHIRVELEPQQGCADRSSNTAYRKPIAFTQWAFDTPAEANLGGLGQLGTLLPRYLALKMDEEAHIYPIDASQQRLPLADDGMGLSANDLNHLSRIHAQLSTQYILTGRIRSVSMERDRTDTENILLDNPLTDLGHDLAHRGGVLGTRDLRFFEAQVDLIDAATGALLQRYRLMTQGAWRLPLHERITGLQSFSQQPYGQAVMSEIEDLIDSVAAALECEPMEARIIRASGSEVWIDKGANSGINQGDRLSVMRQVQIYDAFMNPITEREPTDFSLRIDRVELNRARGTLSELSEVANIQVDDLAVGY